MLVCCALAERAPAEVHLPRPSVDQTVSVSASEASRWQQGAYQVWWLRGDVRVAQGGGLWRGQEAIVWVDQPNTFHEPTKLIVFLEGDANRPVEIEQHAAQASDPSDAPLARQRAPHWFGRLLTVGGVEWATPPPASEPVDKPGVFARGLARFEIDGIRLDADEPPARKQDPKVRPAQFAGDPFDRVAPAPDPVASSPSFRSIELYPRQGAGLKAEVLTSPAGQSVVVLSGGANLVVTGVGAQGLPAGVSEFVGGTDRIDLEADRVVVWTTNAANLGVGGRTEQSGEEPLEVYMEGNIVFRQGERIVYAERMFYDVRRKTGVILDAEVLTPVPDVDGYQYRGLVRLKAESIRQLDDSRYVADNALFTTSRLEEPTYSLRADTITFEDYQRQLIDPATGMPARDPFTGAQSVEREQTATAEGNRVLVGDLPILYWPRIATDLREPAYYIEDFQVRNDAIFGFQVLTELDVYQLLGSKAPPGTNWDVSLDYLSERGFGYGTLYEYDVDYFLGASGPATGRTDLWFINDNDLDNLGGGLSGIDPEQTFRGRAYWSHRQRVTDGILAGWTTQAEIGWLSDRTFLEQYYEREWDEQRDQSTGFRLRRVIDNQSLTIESNAKVNDFFTETQWLPRVDHWLMGQELAGDRLTWFAHSHAGYANQNPASAPSDPTLAAQFFLFPWEVSPTGSAFEGERLATRQEIDLPIDLSPYGAPVKVVPYFLGEVAHWGADLNGEDRQRAYLQTGVRASAPFWAVNPNVRDPLFNLDGLAHKVVFDFEASYADANEDFQDLPLYDELEDNSLEEIRRRVFNPTIPATADPRFYLVRSGIQGWVASPTTEVVDDLSVVRMGMRHRLQTKRGAPGQQRVVDWFTLDTNASLFPEDARDNFGETIGLVDYDMSWHLGDRFTVVSDGFLDLFTDGLQTFSAGVVMNRPSRGNAYLGYRSIRGPFNSDLLIARLNYRLGPKWIASATSVVDFGEAGNIGQNVAVSRIGESLIVTLGANVDEGKGNISYSLLIEPRFLPRTSLTRKTGIDVPPAGAYGLE